MNDNVVDLRSDTVTQPTPEMRRAMAEAELGDDVLRDDPTVIALEERAAEVTGKEAALFVPSGTMGNLVSHLAHVPRGGEIITPAGSHMVYHEAGGHAVVVGARTREIPWFSDGTVDIDALREAFRDPSDVHNPITALVHLENTHSDSMAQPVPAEHISAVAEIAHHGHVPLHVDGARIFNAAVALGTTARELLATADSTTFCLSKGLSCPVGSVVVGGRDFIWRARRARKLVGGGMRQVGVLAAPGLIALRDGPQGMIERLAEDHENARRLASGLVEMDGVVDLDPQRVRTNFVLFRLRNDAYRMPFVEALRRQGVWMLDYSHRYVRAVTHYGISAADIERALQASRRALTEVGLAPVAVAG
ncbi:low-specificity L-threonine aldolase [soil metagenome]